MGLVLSSGGVFTVWEYDIENFTFFYLNFMVEEGVMGKDIICK